MRGAVVIKYGDPEIANAIASGIESAYKVSTNEVAVNRSEIEALRKREAKLGVREVRDENYFKRKIAEANELYAIPESNKVFDTLLGVYGLCVEVISGWFDRFYEEMSR